MLIAHLKQVSKRGVQVPQPVFAEIRYGLARMRDSKRKRTLQRRCGALVDELPRAVWNDEVSKRFGTVKAALERKGSPLEDFDIAIAAHALGEGVILVTGNTKHFSRIPGLCIEDWA